MILNDEMLSILHDWLVKLREGIEVDNGKAMCESSRMVVSICSILWAYHPDEFTEALHIEVRTLFEEALSCISDDLEKDQVPDGYYSLYKRNIGERLKTLNQLAAEPCPV